MKDKRTTVFVSYAREDIEAARRLYTDLKNFGADAWMDEAKLLPGQNFAELIKQTIRDSRYFVALLSTSSVDKRGFVQRELREALDVVSEFPEGEIYLIPARLNSCQPRNSKLAEINWVDLFPSWENGLKRILCSMSVIGLESLQSGISIESLRASRTSSRGHEDSVEQIDLILDWTLSLFTTNPCPPADGFVRIVSFLNSTVLSDDHNQIIHRCFTVLERCYYRVPPPDSNSDKGFSAYCRLLWRYLDSDALRPHCCRRLLEMHELKVESPIFAALVRLPGVVQEYLRSAFEGNQNLRMMIPTVLALCLRASFEGNKSAFEEFTNTVDVCGGKLDEVGEYPSLVMPDGQRETLLLSPDAHVHFLMRQWNQESAAMQTFASLLDSERNDETTG